MAEQHQQTSLAAEEKRCDGCGAPAARLYRCERCSAARYCGAACQQRAWLGGHKAACRAAAAKLAAQREAETRAALRRALIVDAVRTHGRCPCLSPYAREVLLRLRAGKCCHLNCFAVVDLATAPRDTTYRTKCKRPAESGRDEHVLPLAFCGPAHAYLCKDNIAEFNRKNPHRACPCCAAIFADRIAAAAASPSSGSAEAAGDDVPDLIDLRVK